MPRQETVTVRMPATRPSSPSLRSTARISPPSVTSSPRGLSGAPTARYERSCVQADNSTELLPDVLNNSPSVSDGSLLAWMVTETTHSGHEHLNVTDLAMSPGSLAT